MKTMIYDLLDAPMVTGVVSFIKKLEQTKIVNRLYDGTYQIQTVGNPATIAVVVAHATIAQKDNLDAAEATAAMLQCIRDGTVYIGYIKEVINWTPVVLNVLYEGTLTLLINEVVV